jgi:UDP-N-acetylmuramate dehydrogenase
MISVMRDVELRQRNTLALPSRAACVLRADSRAGVREAVLRARDEGWALEVLGEGSNVVLRDRVPGCVLEPDVGGIACEARGDQMLVTAGAGVRWNDLVRWCIAQRCFGIENLALIPGRVGAAPIQNIGAYGVEIESRIDHVEVVAIEDGRTCRFDRADCGFGYRDSRFKRESGSYVIVGVGLLLDRAFHPVAEYPDVRDELSRLAGPPGAAQIAEAVVRVRRRKLPDPRRVPNAGSFFKNPVVDTVTLERLQDRLGHLPTYPAPGGVKVSAARLIDACGWKGRRLGRAGVWWRQPLVLVNLGGARARDVLGLADAIADDVGDRLGVTLELEPRVIGFDDD